MPRRVFNEDEIIEITLPGHCLPGACRASGAVQSRDGNVLTVAFGSGRPAIIPRTRADTLRTRLRTIAGTLREFARTYRAIFALGAAR